MKQDASYYQIKKVHLWIAIFVTMCAAWVVNCKQDLYAGWERFQEKESNACEQLDSKLKNKKKCYLCGKNKKSMMAYYRKFDTIGIISLSDWYVMGLGLQEYEEQENISENDPHISFRMTNLGGIYIIESSAPDRGMATMDISLSQNCEPDTQMLQKNLCQNCLNHMMDALAPSAYPLCLVDFQTLQIYSLQDCYVGYSIRDYWVEIEYDDDRVKIKAFYLPGRREKK